MELERVACLDEVYEKFPGYSIKNIEMSADCDFNFGTRYASLKNILVNNGRDDLMCDLEKCKKRYHQVCNFSLMPATGALGIKKGARYKEDRVDVFLADLEVLLNYIKNMEIEDVLNELKKDYDEKNRKSRLSLLKAYGYIEENKRCLIAFLKSFDDIYDYCEKMYIINDRKYLKDFISKGIEKIVNVDDVISYIKKVNDYWDYREKRLKELGISSAKIEEINKQLSVIDQQKI